MSLGAASSGAAVMLLVGTGLLTRSLLHLRDWQPGFRVDHMLRTHLFLPSARYPNPASITRFWPSGEISAKIPALQTKVLSDAQDEPMPLGRKVKLPDLEAGQGLF